MWCYQFTKGKVIQWTVDLIDIKLLEHDIKVVERIFVLNMEHGSKQFGFMKGKGTTDAILIVRQMHENFRVKGKKVYFGFADLEKAFDRVPREVIRWEMHKLEVEEWLVSQSLLEWQSCLCTQVQKQVRNSLW